jgi:hypothetical protein
MTTATETAAAEAMMTLAAVVLGGDSDSGKNITIN